MTLTVCASDACVNKSTPSYISCLLQTQAGGRPDIFQSLFSQHFCSHLEYSVSVTWQYTMSNEFKKWMLSRNLWKQVYNMVTTHIHSMYFGLIQNYNPHVKYSNLPKCHNLLPKLGMCLLLLVQTNESNLPIVTARYVIKVYQIFIYVCKKPIKE